MANWRLAKKNMKDYEERRKMWEKVDREEWNGEKVALR